MQQILISTECVADLSKQLRKQNDVHYIYFDVQTEEGIFRDTDEVDATNMIEYMNGGRRKVNSVSITVEKYIDYFKDCLSKCDCVVHICIGNEISESYQHALLAKQQMEDEGEHIFLVDSKHLSSGVGLLVLEAVKLKQMGKSAKEIVRKCEQVIPLISTSFIAYNADYLYYNGKVSLGIKNICHTFNLHPVLYVKNGKLKMKKVYFGNYDKATEKYTRSLLRQSSQVDRSQAFLTYVGCSVKRLDTIKQIINRISPFEQLHVVQASATVSCNCGPDTFGILFKRKEVES